MYYKEKQPAWIYPIFVLGMTGVEFTALSIHLLTYHEKWSIFYTFLMYLGGFITIHLIIHKLDKLEVYPKPPPLSVTSYWLSFIMYLVPRFIFFISSLWHFLLHKPADHQQIEKRQSTILVNCLFYRLIQLKRLYRFLNRFRSAHDLEFFTNC